MIWNAFVHSWTIPASSLACMDNGVDGVGEKVSVKAILIIWLKYRFINGLCQQPTCMGNAFIMGKRYNRRQQAA